MLNQPAGAVRVALDPLGDMAPPIAARIREEHDLGLEPLRLVQVHQAHDGRLARLERQRLDLARVLGVGLERLRRFRKAGAALHHLAHAVDGVQQIAGLDATGRRRRQGQIAGVLEHALERRGGGSTRVQR